MVDNKDTENKYDNNEYYDNEIIQKLTIEDQSAEKLITKSK